MDHLSRLCFLTHATSNWKLNDFSYKCGWSRQSEWGSVLKPWLDQTVFFPPSPTSVKWRVHFSSGKKSKPGKWCPYCESLRKTFDKPGQCCPRRLLELNGWMKVCLKVSVSQEPISFNTCLSWWTRKGWNLTCHSPLMQRLYRVLHLVHKG